MWGGYGGLLEEQLDPMRTRPVPGGWVGRWVGLVTIDVQKPSDAVCDRQDRKLKFKALLRSLIASRPDILDYAISPGPRLSDIALVRGIPSTYDRMSSCSILTMIPDAARRTYTHAWSENWVSTSLIIEENGPQPIEARSLSMPSSCAAPGRPKVPGYRAQPG